MASKPFLSVPANLSGAEQFPVSITFPSSNFPTAGNGKANRKSIPNPGYRGTKPILNLKEAENPPVFYPKKAITTYFFSLFRKKMIVKDYICHKKKY